MSRKKPKKKKQKKILRVLKGHILEIFKANSSRTLNYKQVSSLMEIHDHESRKIVSEALLELVDEEKLIEAHRGKYKYNATTIVITGIIDAIKRGGAYLVSDDTEEDVYIAPRNMNQSLHGDLVKVSIFTGGRRKRPEGEVVEVINQHQREFVGVLTQRKKYAFMIPDNPSISVQFTIPLNEIKTANNGDKVIAKITDWPLGAEGPFATVEKVLGAPGENETEIHAILAEFGLPLEFPEDVALEAAKIPLEIPKEVIAQRRDFRDITTFTIDPLDAKDFDDALSLQQLENGNWEVGVHIADVSHYVPEGSIIDKEALSRATSVYLVDRVVPMLPETLSNKVCSLRPNEEKCTFSAVFEMDDNAKVINEWFGRTVINSDRRFTYEEAQAIIEGAEGDYKEEILTLDRLAKKMRGLRMKKGAIEFSSREVKFELDEKANPIRVFEKVTKDSNKLIEEFMLLANKKVAAFIGKSPKNQAKKTFVYRVHDEPDPEKLSLLVRFLEQFNYKLRIKPSDISGSLNRLLADFENRNEKAMVEQMTIRSMAKAIYTTQNIGHFGLGFGFYTHFTSPIRRYPDLVVHRLLQRYLDNGPSVNTEKIETICKHSSLQEKQAAGAERASIKYKQVQFMMEHIGEEFEGTVSGVTEWGMYIEINENRCEGMISIRSIGDDYYYFDERKYCIRGRHHGATFHLGDQVVIRVKGADLMKKQLDFELVQFA